MSKEALQAWPAGVALRGPDAPKDDGSIKHLIEYLLTVYERFGNTRVTADLQWGATALHKMDAQKVRIAELEAELAEFRARGYVPEAPGAHGAAALSHGVQEGRAVIERDAEWRNLLQRSQVPGKQYLYCIKPGDIDRHLSAAPHPASDVANASAAIPASGDSASASASGASQVEAPGLTWTNPAPNAAPSSKPSPGGTLLLTPSTADSASRRVGDGDKYDEVLLPFLALMRKELHENSGKGDRPGWLSMNRDQAVLEIYYHVAKLQKAMRDDDHERIKENTADVANMAMMALDIGVGIEPSVAASATRQPPMQAGEDELAKAQEPTRDELVESLRTMRGYFQKMAEQADGAQATTPAHMEATIRFHRGVEGTADDVVEQLDTLLSTYKKED